MSLLIDVTVPALGESITEATVLEWLVAPGQSVTADQELVALETDKITVNVPAPAAGVLAEVVAEVGAEVEVGSVVARIDRGGAAAGSSPPPPIAEATAPAPVPPTTAAPKRVSAPPPQAAPAADLPPMMPAVRRLVAEHGLDPHAIRATGRGGRLLKGDVLAHLSGGDGGTTPAGPAAARAAAAAPAQVPPAAPAPAPTAAGRERVVPMSRLRRRIAENLVSAQQNAAMLTTFNEVDMSAVMALDLQAGLPGPLRDQARFHVLLRQGSGRGAQADPRCQRRGPRRPHHLQGPLRHRRRGGRRPRSRGPGGS